MKHHVVNPSPATHLHAYGATLGEEWLKPLVEELTSRTDDLAASSGELVLLDFAGIETATASFLKATIIYLLKAGQRAAVSGETLGTDNVSTVPALNIYPCVLGLSADVQEELTEVLASQRMVCLEALAWDNTALQKARLRGPIERPLWDTLQHLTVAPDGLTASELHRQHPAESINPTAWNNRLADLYRLRLVRRIRQGRHWLYSSIAREVVRG